MTSVEVLCRPALASDRDDVMGFLPLIWEGEDYVPDVWEQWLHDDQGRLAAAVHQGRVVGLSHLVHLGEGEWWLEGLRVDPRLQGRHIGSHLHDYQVENWLRTDGRVLRLATHSTRTAVHRMCDRTALVRIASVEALEADPGPGSHEFRPLAVSEAPAAVDRFRRSAPQQALGGLMDLGWRYAEIQPDRIAAVADRGELWTWRGSAALLATTQDRHEGGAPLTISALVPPAAKAAPFLTETIHLAHDLGAQGVLWLAPQPWADQAVAAGGWQAQSEGPLWIYERRR